MGHIRCIMLDKINPSKKQTLWFYSSRKTQVQFSSVTQSCLTLQLHEPQRARHPCPLPIPGVHPISSSLSQWCYPTISSSVIPFSSCPQSFPASESFPMSQLFTWDWRLAKVLEFQPQHQSFQWTPRTGLAVQGTLRSLLQHHSSKASILRRSDFFIAQLSHPYMSTGKTTPLLAK